MNFQAELNRDENLVYEKLDPNCERLMTETPIKDFGEKRGWSRIVETHLRQQGLEAT